MTAVYARSPTSILAHLLALSALADRWKAFSFQCSGKPAYVIRQRTDLDAEPNPHPLNISPLKYLVNECILACASNEKRVKVSEMSVQSPLASHLLRAQVA